MVMNSNMKNVYIPHIFNNIYNYCAVDRKECKEYNMFLYQLSEKLYYFINSYEQSEYINFFNKYKKTIIMYIFNKIQIIDFELLQRLKYIYSTFILNELNVSTYNYGFGF